MNHVFFLVCPDSYSPNCSPGPDYFACCFNEWIGDGECDGADQPYNCDLSCYNDDGGDCGERISFYLFILHFREHLCTDYQGDFLNIQ